MLRIQRTRQPAGFAKPDFSHPSNDRIAFLWSAASPLHDAVTGAAATTNNTSITGGVANRAVSCSTGQRNIEWAGRNFVTTSDGAGGGDFSAIVIANPIDGAGAVGHIFAQKNDAGGSPFAQFALMANSDAAGSYASTSISFFTFNSVGSTSAAVTGQLDGNYHVWGMTRRGTTMYLYRDGVLIASNTNTLREITQSSPARYIAIGSRGNGTTESFGRQVVFAWASNRALSPQEHARLGCSLNAVWQLYEPQTIWVGTASSGSSGTVNYTNANDTSSASGTTTVTGSLAKTNANDTSSASGTTTVTGSLATTNANDTVSASGSAGSNTGTVNYTNANDTVSASGWAGTVTGTVSYSNLDDSVSARGETPRARRGAAKPLRKGYIIRGKKYWLTDDELAIMVALELETIKRSDIKVPTKGRIKPIPTATFEMVRAVAKKLDELASIGLDDDEDEEEELLLML